MLIQDKTTRGFELLELFCRKSWNMLTVCQDSVILEDRLVDGMLVPGSSALVIGDSRVDRRTVAQLASVLTGWLANGRLHGHVRASKDAIKLRAAIMDKKECPICGHVPTDYFMLTDEVWAQAGLNKDQVACLSCVALALGRAIQVSDFTGAPINIRWRAIFGDIPVPKKRRKK